MIQTKNSNIWVRIHGTTYRGQSLVFNGGEVQIAFPALDKIVEPLIVEVIARVQSSEDLVALILATEVVQRLFPNSDTILNIPYFPYARQDRVTDSTVAFSLKSISKVINGLGYDEVCIADPHSDVTPALIDKVTVTSQLDIIKQFPSLKRLMLGEVLLIAPDQGATKKTFEVAKHFGKPMTTAIKHRDTVTGEITGTTLTSAIYSDAVKHALIIDDICDGGRTFVELAKKLKEYSFKTISLYVTHGIFSQGLAPFEGLIDEVFTTDTFISESHKDSKELSPNVKLTVYSLIQEI